MLVWLKYQKYPFWPAVVRTTLSPKCSYLAPLTLNLANVFTFLGKVLGLEAGFLKTRVPE